LRIDIQYLTMAKDLSDHGENGRPSSQLDDQLNSSSSQHRMATNGSRVSENRVQPPPGPVKRCSFSDPVDRHPRPFNARRGPTPYPSPQHSRRSSIAGDITENNPNDHKFVNGAGPSTKQDIKGAGDGPFTKSSVRDGGDDSGIDMMSSGSSQSSSNPDMNAGNCWACNATLVYTGLGPSGVECVECWAPQHRM
jgi:hypothetical protein